LKFETTLRFSEMPAHSQKVYFHSLQNSSFLKERKKLKVFIEAIFKKEKKTLQELHYIFCSDDYLLKINQQYLNHDYYTDIITFDLSEGRGIIGEVYICIDRLKENAKNFDSSYSKELHRLLFHGALHLCGYKDKTSTDKKLMNEKEEHYLRLYKNVPQKTVSA
jgi:probable rRNA maturation factor